MTGAQPRVVRVAVDVPALADQRRELDYLVPPDLDAHVAVGTLVRVPLHGRRVAGWVVEDDVEPPPGIALSALARVSSVGPAPDLVELTEWGAWRWAGRRTALLRAASPPVMVRSLPPGAVAAASRPAAEGELGEMAREAIAAGEAVMRVPPATDLRDVVAALSVGGPALIACPSVDEARGFRGALTLPSGWARTAAGGVSAAGARTAVWASAPDARVLVVVDAHDRALSEDRAPAWDAWVVAAERGRRHEMACVLVSPCPTLEQLRWGRLVAPSRAAERDGWAAVDVLDRTDDDPRTGLLGERLVPILRRATIERPVVCMLNRKGRVRMLACRACRHLTVCETCGGPMEQPAETDVLRCRRCRRERPVVCQACGAGTLRAVRAGVTKVREDLQALVRVPVGEVTAETQGVPDTPVIIGTEAVLRRLGGAARSGRGAVGAVIFLDFDAELLAPRFRAGEDAFALLAAAARAVGGRGGGRVVVQTRLPSHHVIAAAVHADPGRMAEPEMALRRELRLPPFAALASLSGDPSVAADVAGALGAAGLELSPVAEGRWIARASDHTVLCDALARVGRPPGATNTTLRIDVDPHDV